MKVEAFMLLKSDLGRFITGLKADYEVIGPVAKDAEFVFAPIDSADELRLDYDTTILPPHKKHFLPPQETLFGYKRPVELTEGQPKVDTPRLLFGVHPCDVNALLSLDQVFLGNYPDGHYRARRENTVIVGLNCSQPCKNGFCSSFSTGPAMDKGFDLILTDIGDGFIIEIGSEKGSNLVNGLSKASEEEIVVKNQTLRAAQQMITRRIDAENLAELLHQNVEHPVWQELKEECLACGSCTNVCPTCFCFAVKDYVDLSLQSGVRVRTWDSCQFYEFSKVAQEHVFRPDRAARIKQRIYHKLSYFGQQFNASGCVGCGRCVTNCIVNIDPVQIVEKIQTNPQPEQKINLYQPPKKKVCPDKSPIKPQEAIIKAIKPQTADTNTFALAFTDSAVQENYTYDPGVFNMISVYGIGEAPISVSSSANLKGSFEHTIRAVGNLSNFLTGLKEGDRVQVRGPFGNGWPMEEMKGKNILLIAGGIGLAPIRPVIKHIEARREQYGALEILYGARSPQDMLFTDEFAQWQDMDNTKLYLTVDSVPPGMDWMHNIGVVTALFEQMASNPENTMVLTCGPGIMMKFVVKGLLARGFTPEQIFVSLERRMSCGIKKCGNCQIGPVFVCQDGPVFRYADVKDLPEEIF